MNKKRPENAGKCICESLEIQNFLGGAYPPVTLKYPLVQKLIETPAFMASES